MAKPQTHSLETSGVEAESNLDSYLREKKIKMIKHNSEDNAKLSALKSRESSGAPSDRKIPTAPSSALKKVLLHFPVLLHRFSLRRSHPAPAHRPAAGHPARPCPRIPRASPVPAARAAQRGSARFCPFQLSSARISPVRLSSAQLGLILVPPGTARLDSA